MSEPLQSSQPEFAACTIIAKNYLPMARVLTESWNAFHPDYPLYVLLLDSPRGFFAPEDEAFQSVFLPELEIPNLNGFMFKYSILESSTAVKPYFLSYLFRCYAMDKLLYLDPDILILNSLASLRNYLEEANVLLTPHLLSPLPNDGRKPNDHDILQAGTYNLGFVGLRKGGESQRLLRWWSDKVYHHCIVAFESNLFVDQRWMDLVPGLFDGVRIVREPGYNLAYWNLHERVVALDNDPSVNGEPLYFFHASGFDPDKPSIVSKHQDRFQMADIGDTRKLYSRYRDLLIEKGRNETRNWKFSYDFFRNGVKIPPSARRYYWSLGTDVMHLGDPFSWLDEDSEGAMKEGSDPQETSQLPPGINLLGYLESEKGVGEGGRSNLRIVQATGIPYSVNNLVDRGSHNVENAVDKITSKNPYSTNLITVNADQFVSVAKQRRSYMKGRFNIGYWAWELPEFPEEWTPAFGYADEIWTPSQFTCDSVATCSPVPVRVVPHSLDPNTRVGGAVDRFKFGLRPGTFVFLFFFDFHSFFARKNPLGLIEAYKNAFGDRQDVQLLIKSAHSAEHKEELLMLQKASSGANVSILDAVMTREAKEELMMAADCYVSLHRSEGFGLTLAEAMMFGKPVIATGYSGNVDFMSDDDSYLVPYRLITIDQTHGPYKAGYHWAQPDLDYACDLMRHVETSREAAAEKGLKAQVKIREILHPATIAASVRDRLEELGLVPQTTPAEAHSGSQA
ncbi:MAG: glycosyltransferase [Candidatus Korobacteraceae bacterium]